MMGWTDTMNGAYVYQVTEEVMRDILKLPGMSKEFAKECKDVAEKYRYRPYTKQEIDKIVEDTGGNNNESLHY